MTLTDPESLTLGHGRIPYYQVVSVRGKVLGARKQTLTAEERVGPVKYISLDQARVLPADVSWKDFAPRLRRRRGICPDIRTLMFDDLQAERRHGA